MTLRAAEAVATRIEAILPHRPPVRRPFVLGLYGAQGSGRSTTAAVLTKRLRARARARGFGMPARADLVIALDARRMPPTAPRIASPGRLL